MKIEKEFDQADDIILLIDHGSLCNLETVELQLTLSRKTNKDEGQTENTKTYATVVEKLKLKIEKEFDQANDVIWLIDHGRL